MTPYDQFAFYVMYMKVCFFRWHLVACPLQLYVKGFNAEGVFLDARFAFEKVICFPFIF